MRKFILSIFNLLTVALGWLPAIIRREIFRMSARSIGVRYAVFENQQGPLEAPVYDRVIWPLYLSQGALDSGTCNFVAQLFGSNSGTLVDVGANLGVLCIPIKKAVPTIDAYAIEADPDNFKCLEMNIIRNNVSDIKLFNRAAYRQEGVLNFERSNDNSGDHRIRSGKGNAEKELCDESSRSIVQVQAAPLDSLLPISQFKKPVVVVCDVQGAEAEVFAGAKNLFNSTDVLIMEFWPYALKRANANLDELMSIISIFSYGSQFDTMDKDSIRLVPIQELTQRLRQLYSSENGIRHYDLILSKKIF